MLKKLNGNALATILGIIGSICTAFGTLDVDTMDFTSFKTYFKLFIVAIPAGLGYMSTIKNRQIK